MPAMTMSHDTDPKQEILAAIGSLDGFETFHNDLIVAVYLRPEKTASGIYLPESYRDEDKYQGKVGLVVKMGPEAFNDPSGAWFQGISVQEGDWVYFRPSDGFAMTVNKVLCRSLKDTNIRGKVPHPDFVW